MIGFCECNNNYATILRARRVDKAPRDIVKASDKAKEENTVFMSSFQQRVFKDYRRGAII